MTSSSPGVRRLCVCVGGATCQGILDSACGALAAAVLYQEHFPEEGIDLGFASPGVDEPALVSDLIVALHDAVAQTRTGRREDGGYRRPGDTAPVFAAFHVGITRVQGNDIGGVAVTRVRELLRVLASSDLASQAAGMLVAGISATLFDDIGAEQDFGQGWTPLAGCSGGFSRIEAWCRTY